jgi:hypothetical protein
MEWVKRAGIEKVSTKMVEFGFGVSLLCCITAAILFVILIWNGLWICGVACGFAFVGFAMKAFWLAMTALLEDSRRAAR